MIFYLSVILIALVVVIGFFRFTRSGTKVPRIIQELDHSGKIVLITGCTAGIGFHTAKALALLGFNVIFACRNKTKTHRRMEEIKKLIQQKEIKNGKKIGSVLTFIKLDLADLDSVREFCKQVKSKFKKINVLINNAGIGTEHGVTKQNFEKKFGVNHLGHFLLTNLLIDLIVKGDGRVITVSSRSQVFSKRSFFDVQYKGDVPKNRGVYYKRSKIANILFTKSLHRRFMKMKNKKLAAVSLHPGIVRTNIFWNTGFFGRISLFLIDMFIKSPEEGANTSIYLSLLPNLPEYSGEHFSECKIVRGKLHFNQMAHDVKLQERLWKMSEDFVNQKFSF